MISAILSIGRDDNMMYYVFSIIGILPIFLIMFFVKKESFFAFNSLDSFFLISVSIMMLLSLMIRFEPMGIIMLLLFVALIVYFKVVKLSSSRLLTLTPITIGTG